MSVDLWHTLDPVSGSHTVPGLLSTLPRPGVVIQAYVPQISDLGFVIYRRIIPILVRVLLQRFLAPVDPIRRTLRNVGLG